MRTATELIAQVRLVSRNTANPDGSYGITAAEVLQYLNDAQDRLQNLLSATKNIAKIFVTQELISLTANQEAYSISDRVLMNKQIEFVEFSVTGLVTDYVRLEKLHFLNRDTAGGTYPRGYFKRGNQILIQPTPSATQGVVRVSYERELDDLAESTDIVSGTPATTDIVVTTGSATFSTATYICIEALDGTVLLRNGVVDSYDAPTKTITLAADVDTYLVGDAVLADLDGGYVQLGKYVTRISKLPDSCERYLIHYAAAELLRKDSSADYDRAAGLVSEIEDDIISVMRAQTGEIQYIPQTYQGEW